MKRVKLLSLSFVLMLSLYSIAQTTIPNVSNFKSKRQSDAILENGKIVGYYVFYFKEKADKKNSTYEIEIFDDNFSSQQSFEITRPKNTTLMEMVYNGEAFMFFFYDRKTGYEFITYNRAGESLGSSTIGPKEISNYDLQRSMESLNSGTDNVTIMPMGNKGFIRQGYTKNKRVGYQIVAYNNNAEKLWEYGSNDAASKLETCEINDISAEMVTATIYHKKNAMTKQMDLTFLILNTESGKKLAETDMGTEETGKKSVLKAFIEAESQKITLIGEYYKPGDDIMKDKSAGIFVQEINASGNVQVEKEYAWKGAIDAFKQENLDEEDKKEAGKSFSIYFHDAIRAKNGHLFLVGEQFKKQVSAGAVAGKIAMAAIGNKGALAASNFEIRVGNMIVIELDEKAKLVKFDIVNKRKTSVLLPEGYGIYGSAFLGFYINSIGGFDYEFTSRDRDADKFSVVYTDYNRKEDSDSKKTDMMLGVITVDKGKHSTNRVPINTDAKRWWVNAAKPGYISIGEYYRKEKKLTFRLEPISY